MLSRVWLNGDARLFFFAAYSLGVTWSIVTKRLPPVQSLRW